MMAKYHRGRRFEYKVKRNLEDNGYLVFRMAGSKPIDLIALKNGEVLLIECKTYKNVPKGEIEKLREMANRAGARAKIVTPEGEIDLD
ncbi:MAG: restriction endonuclease [Candidatus Methanospirareceae archaeon]